MSLTTRHAALYARSGVITAVLGVAQEASSAEPLIEIVTSRYPQRIRVVSRARRGTHTSVTSESFASLVGGIHSTGTAVETSTAQQITVNIPPRQQKTLVVSAASAAPQVHRSHPGSAFVIAPPVLVAQNTASLNAAIETDSARPIIVIIAAKQRIHIISRRSSLMLLPVRHTMLRSPSTTSVWGPPPNLAVTPVSDTELDLSWDAVPGASGYDIEREDVVIALDVTDTFYSDTDLDESTTYIYRVRSVRA